MTARETDVVTVAPGANPDRAAARLARYIVDRWMPGNAGGIHLVATPRMASVLLQFFQRQQPTDLVVDTRGLVPVIRER